MNFWVVVVLLFALGFTLGTIQDISGNLERIACALEYGNDGTDYICQGLFLFSQRNNVLKGGSWDKKLEPRKGEK